MVVLGLSVFLLAALRPPFCSFWRCKGTTVCAHKNHNRPVFHQKSVYSWYTSKLCVRTQKPQITPQNARTPFVYRRL